MKSNSTVSVWQENIVIPTYGTGKPEKNPMFLENRVYQGSSGVVYPYPVIEKILDHKEDKTYNALFLENQYLNLLITEPPNGDWAQTILRQFFFSTYQQLLYTELQKNSDGQLAAIAEKSLKEVIYHLRWSSEWVVRLGDGTKESHHRIKNACDELWRFTGEMFIQSSYEFINMGDLKGNWEEKVKEIFDEALLPSPFGDGLGVSFQKGGKEGKHTEHLGYTLTEMQYLQRAYPNSKW